MSRTRIPLPETLVYALEAGIVVYRSYVGEPKIMLNRVGAKNSVHKLYVFFCLTLTDHMNFEPKYMYSETIAHFSSFWNIQRPCTDVAAPTCVPWFSHI